MAFVGISKDFISRTESKIQNMRNLELKTLGETPSVALSQGDPIIISTFYKAHADLYPKLPDEWCQFQGKINLKIRIPEATRKKEQHNFFSFRAECTQDVGFKLPLRTSTYDDHLVDATEPVLQSVVDYAIRKCEIEQRWETVHEKVITFLLACKSANEAVKLWPDVKVYFHPDDIGRIEHKVVRAGSSESNAAKALAGIDTGEIMSAAVIARLSGAQL